MSHNANAVFFWCHFGQRDNIGDIVLRRRMMRFLRMAGQCHVYVGPADAQFVEAMQFTESDVVYTSRPRWLLAMVRRLGRETVFAFNPGELVLTPRHTASHLVLFPLLVVLRLLAGRILWIGAGVRQNQYVGRRLVALSARLCTTTIWRDEESAALFRAGRPGPDWAFDEPGPAAEEDVAPGPRDLMAITFRTDRPRLSPEIWAGLSAAAAELGLTPVFYSQVRRDNDHNAELAARLGYQFVNWDPSVSMADHERRVRALLRRSALVVSDRLHALVMGVTEGAIPAGLVPADDKVARTFRAAGFGSITHDVWSGSGEDVRRFLIALAEDRDQVAKQAQLARERIAGYETLLPPVRLFSGTDSASRRLRIDYLVGAPRISIRPGSNTPGPRTHILQFTRAAAGQGHEVRLLVASQLPMMGRFARIRQNDYQNASAGTLWMADLVRVLATLWTGMFVVVRSARRRAPDVIYERASVLQSAASFHLRRSRAVRVVEANGIMSRETAVDRKVLRSTRLAASVERHVYRRADIVVAVSEPLRHELIAFADLDPAKVLVVPNGVDECLLDIPRAGVQANVMVGFVGSVVAWQRLDWLIDSFAIAVRAVPNACLEIIGDGPMILDLVTRCQEHGLDEHVRFLGKLEPADVLRRMASWRVGFAGHGRSSSATMYHSPLKLYEYAAMGLDIVASPSGDAAGLAASGVRVFSFTDGPTLTDALVGALNSAVAGDRDDAAVRSRVVAEHGWSERVDRVVEACERLRADGFPAGPAAVGHAAVGPV